MSEIDSLPPGRYCARHDTYSSPECLPCVRQERDELKACIGQLQEWVITYGSQLCPRGADTYGEGVRDSKAAVQAIIRRALATTEEPSE